MKTLVIFPFLIFLAITVTSCKKEFPNDSLAIKYLSVSDCKTKGDLIKGFDPEYITLKTVDDFYLQFNHFNSIFNCDPGQITVSIEISSTSITLNENEAKAGANCICPYDIVFSLGPLEYGSYSIIFQKGGLTFQEYSLDYNSRTNEKIDL